MRGGGDAGRRGLVRAYPIIRGNEVRKTSVIARVPVKRAGWSRSFFIRGRETTGERVPRFRWKSHALCCDDLLGTTQCRCCLEFDGSERLRRRDWSGQHSPNFPSGLDARVEHGFRRIGLRGQSLCTAHKPEQPDTREPTGHNRCNQVKGEHGQQTVTRHRRTLKGSHTKSKARPAVPLADGPC